MSDEAWESFNTPRLWAMVKDEDDPIGRRQVAAWRALAGSARRQSQELRAARDELATAWPPERNESSAAFLTELDTLIARLDGASVDADTTATGLDRIMNALQTAKVSIEPLWEQYRDGSDSLTPNWFDRAEDELDEQARRHMISMELAVRDAVALLKVPSPYRLSISESVGWPPSSDDQGYGRGGLIGVAVPHDPVPPLPGFLPDGVVPPVVVPGGPDLAGVITPVPPPVPPPGDVGVGAPPGGPVAAGGALPPGPLPIGGGGRLVGAGGSLPAGSASALPIPGGSLPAGLLPGGGAAVAPAALPVAGATAPGASAGGNPLVPGLMPGMGGGLGRPGGARRALAEDGYDSSDPDEPWAVAKGVSPVIAPDSDGVKHDPGPNVIGYRG